MAATKHGAGLQIIFSFFLGLMVTAFVGIGVYTFNPSPDQELSQQIRELNRREQLITNSKSIDALTEDERSEIQALTLQRNDLRDQVEAVVEPWMRSTSIILLLFATLVMAISLIRADQLPVISNGLLLGGVFTMVYGVGWIVATDSSISRFIVMSVGLAITLALGYVRFVARKKSKSADFEQQSTGDDSIEELNQRLSHLEQKIDTAAEVLARKD